MKVYGIDINKLDSIMSSIQKRGPSAEIDAVSTRIFPTANIGSKSTRRNSTTRFKLVNGVCVL